MGAFDYLGRNQGENQLFGISSETSNNKKHFDNIMYELLVNNSDKYSKKSDWNKDYPNDYKTDLELTDTLGKDMKYRLNMYSPLYYLNKKNQGYKISDVANYFRINTGTFQSDTSNAVDINLYLALLNYGKNVKFTTVWEKKHVLAERTGDSDTNFIAWIAEIEKNENNNNFSNHIKMHSFVYILFLLILL